MQDFAATLDSLQRAAAEMNSANGIDYVTHNYRTFSKNVHRTLAQVKAVLDHIDGDREELRKEVAAMGEALTAARRELATIAEERNRLIAAMGTTSDPEPAPEVHTFTIQVVGDIPAPLRMMLESLRVTE